MTGTSKEYASALFMLAKENSCEKEVSDSLSLMMKAISGTPQISEFMKSPAIPISARTEALKKAFEDSVHEYAMSFLLLICEHGKADIFSECVSEYFSIYNFSKNISHAVITSAVALTDTEKAAVIKKLGERFNKNFDAEYHIEPSLIGGIRIEADGMIIDGSLKNRLHTIKEVMEK